MRGRASETQLRMSETHRGHRGRPRNWAVRRHTSTQHLSWLPVPPSPVFILLTITKAIYLFHLERDLVLVTSLECPVAFIPPAPPQHVCLTCRPRCVVSGVSAPGHRCLCLTYSFQGALLCVPEWAPQGTLASHVVGVSQGSRLHGCESSHVST